MNVFIDAVAISEAAFLLATVLKLSKKAGAIPKGIDTKGEIDDIPCKENGGGLIQRDHQCP